ncbi:Zinc finger protein [Plakobranchus ocellatus]|uniref:Zinc finger protein n=1 Tax=Plakobranchus ocellatus TaxID=259542 RepID=A0AAV4DR30_9GAST|nr:Zinc finger protein [Plakobranchus ocellatus]
MLKLASGKSVPVMTNYAALRDPEKTGSLGLPVIKGEIGGRKVDVMRDTGCEGVVVRKQLVDASQLTGQCCLLLRIDNTALLAERAVISLRTPFLSGEVKALCIPDAICDVIVGNVEGARSPEDPGMSVMMTRARAKHEAVTKPLRVPDIERHVGVHREQLIKLQQEDPRILALVDAGRTSRKGGKVVSFEKARGIVYRRYEDLGHYVDVKQVVLPKPLREYVMSVAHDSITGVHLGIRRTKDKVLSNFYWPGVDGDVTRYCRSCDVCQRTVKKGTVPRVPLEKVPLIDTPFKRDAIDLVGPINPRSEVGHGFILMLVDYATRFAEAVPLRKIDPESVAEALVDIYSRLGVPEEVLSDQGTQFISDCMKEVCCLLGIKLRTTTLYHPMCNGLVERFNAALKTCLRRLRSEQPRQWHRYINPLLFAYREVPQESTHFAPFELLYGRTVRGSMHILCELWTKEIVKSSYEYVLNLRERLDDTLKIAREELEKAQGRQKHYYDRTAKRRKFSVGEKVLVLLPTDSNKLLMQWKGPFEIVATVGINMGGKQLEKVALMYSSIFSDRPGIASTEEHCIQLTSSIPVRQRPYPVPYAMRQTLRDELGEMEDLGVSGRVLPLTLLLW